MSEQPGAALFGLELEPEPTQFGRSRSRLRDLEIPVPESVPELPKKKAGPQHWLGYTCIIVSVRARP